MAAFTAMQAGAGWGESIPEILRNGDWNYAMFSPDGKLKNRVNQAECLACHKPLAADGFVFSLEARRVKARMER